MRATASTVEILHGGARVASYVRSYVRGGRTTTTEHMPSTHRAHAEWTPTRILSWAEKVGPNTRGLCETILASAITPSGAFARASACSASPRSTGEPRVEAASTRALYAGARSYRPVKTILQNSLDTQPLPRTGRSRRPRAPRRRTCAVATTTTDRETKEKREC